MRLFEDTHSQDRPRRIVGFVLAVIITFAVVALVGCVPGQPVPSPCAINPAWCVAPSPAASPVTPPPSTTVPPSPPAPASPSPAPPSPAPSATPSPAPPSPAPQVCRALVALPKAPVRVVASGACPKGLEPLAWNGQTLCFAKSDERADIGDGPGVCHPCAQHVANDLRNGHAILHDGFVLDQDELGRNGYRDAYCRRTLDRETILEGSAGSWTYWGDCPPLPREEVVPCPTGPGPGPVPSPSPAPSPSTGACTLPIARFGIGFFGTQGAKTNYQGTYRFGTGNGKPCDGSHLACDDPRYTGVGQCEPCGGAVCEDPRGAEWSAGGGAELVSVSGGEAPYGYHATVKGDTGWVKACPPPNPHARQGGTPLAVTGTGCSSVRIGDKP